jgi:hypothetical protein
MLREKPPINGEDVECLQTLKSLLQINPDISPKP